jgi:hypothetical protein
LCVGLIERSNNLIRLRKLTVKENNLIALSRRQWRLSTGKSNLQRRLLIRLSRLLTLQVPATLPEMREGEVALLSRRKYEYGRRGI